MNEFQDQLVQNFKETLELVRSDVAGSCSMRWPVKSDGSDDTGAADYDCISSIVPDTLSLLSTGGGMLADYTFTLTMNRLDFQDELPISGDLFKKNNRVSRILIIDNNDVSPILLIHCGTPNK